MCLFEYARIKIVVDRFHLRFFQKICVIFAPHWFIKAFAENDEKGIRCKSWTDPLL